MSPAGGWEQLNAAVAAGADAVYFGLQHFSARAKVGFGLKELPDVIKHLHRHSVKGFVTFNTLVFDHELRQAQDTIIQIAESGTDAIIVQDVGVAQLAHQLVPQLAIHGSTQMTITSAQGAELAKSLGCSRVVLGRELSLADIRRIAGATDVELEVFVHGALCVSYSGQCFSSEAWGGRSANRGQCAQACRLSYDLIVDDKHRELGDSRYLLSPGDLYAVEQIPELVDIGVACFKIEGRYKGTEYVALTTKAYREAIDNALGRSTDQTVSKNDLEQIYSRGLGPSFISGVDHQAVVNARAPRHRGLQVGEVVEVSDSHVIINAKHKIARGDGLVFDSADWRSPDEEEEGGNVFEVKELKDRRLILAFRYGELNFERIRPGDLVFRSNSPAINKMAKSIAKQKAPTTGLQFKVIARCGGVLSVEATSDNQETATFRSNEILSAATDKAINRNVTEQQLARLGNTPFHFTELKLETDDATFCPMSLLNEARRTIVDQLIAARVRLPHVIVKETKQTPDEVDCRKTSNPKLHLLVRNSQQLHAAIDLKPESITLDYLELYGLRPAVELIQSADITARVASPRILKPSEQKVVRFLLSLNCQILIRSGGLLYDLVTKYRDHDKFVLPELHGDFSLNAANWRSFQLYLDMGLTRITPTYDLNAQQIQELTNVFDSSHIEVVAFHHLPVFHTEHCVFCRFLSDGTDNTNCGHPCEKHKVALRDAKGRQHAVMADVGCRNTVFNAQAQVSLQYVERWLNSRISDYRLEFVHESSDDVIKITESFLDFFKSKNSSQLRNQMLKFTDQGISEGSLFVPKDFKQLVQLGS